MRILSALAVCSLVLGCQSTPTPAPVVAPEGQGDAVAEARRAKDPRTLHPAAVDDGIPFADYKTTIIRQLMRLTKSREVTIPAADVIHGDGPPAYTIEVLKKIGHAESFIVTTVGFGRVTHGAEGKGRVELLAYVEQYGPKIAEVLAALGKAMHARGPEAPPWKEYDTVQIPKSEHGYEFFDLRPAGEVEISPDVRVVLLKVLPMTPEEFERTQKNAAGEWDDPNATARAFSRWRKLADR